MAASSVFAAQVAGFELMQRLPDTPNVQMNACGPEIPVPELVASFWSKTNRGAAQFPVYMRAFREAADQQKAMNGGASFMVMAEEEEVRQSAGLAPRVARDLRRIKARRHAVAHSGHRRAPPVPR